MGQYLCWHKSLQSLHQLEPLHCNHFCQQGSGPATCSKQLSPVLHAPHGHNVAL